jgi:integrase
MKPELAPSMAFRPWSEEIGFLPNKVTVYEDPHRSLTLYLRWRAGGNWRKKSLRRTLRTNRGTIDRDVQKWAREQAQAQFSRLQAGTAATNAPGKALTLRAGLARVLDAETGKYLADSPHRREVMREMQRAIELWGESTTWDSLRVAELRKLWRWRIRQLRADGATGYRGAEITVQRVAAVAAWLRDQELIPVGACVVPRKWKDELASDWIAISGETSVPEPQRPRHSLAEMRAIMAVAGQVDPRFELVMALGAELRLGQVLRVRRSDVSLEHATLTIRGRGKKRGVVVELTDGQMRVVRHHLTEGYLRDLERAEIDYPLFPAGQMKGGRSGRALAEIGRHSAAQPINRSVLDGWFRDAEALARVEDKPITHVPGRGAYGLRRVAVDAAKAAGISREGLKEHGGWSDTQVPDRIYADKDAEYARLEARDVRAKIRGEDGE